MKLTDFYNQKKIGVTSVNKKIGDVTLNAYDVNAVAKNDIGILVPTLKDGKVPDSQLPLYAKLVNGKILSVNIPNATNDRMGGIILGDGFIQNNDGTVDAIGTVSKKQKQEKIDIIKTNGSGNYVLNDKGEYVDVTNSLRTRIQFKDLNQNNDVVFAGKLPIVSILSENNNYYTIQTGDVQILDDITVLHMTRFILFENIQTINSNWVAFVASSIKYVNNKQELNEFKNIAFNEALIYG